MLDSTTISSIYISAVDSASVDATQEVVENFLYKKYQNDSTYSVMNQTQMLETANETASILSLMLGGCRLRCGSAASHQNTAPCR